MSRYLIIIICIIIASAVGFGLVWPKYKEITVIQQKIKEKTQELSYQEQYLEELGAASLKLKQHSPALEKINSSLPQRQDLPALFKYFQKIASQNGLVLQTIPLPSVKRSDKIGGQEIKFSLSLSGSYSSLKNFIATIYKSARFIEAESISFSSPQKQESFKFNVGLKMYSY